MSVSNDGYVDVADALSRIGGNMDLYKRLLGRFVDGNQLDALETALASADHEESARAAHTFKGIAANLSLVKLRELSASLEQDVKAGLDYSAKLSEIKDAYSETVKIIAEIMG